MESLLTLHEEEGRPQPPPALGKVLRVRSAPRREVRGKKVSGKKH